MTKTRIVFRVIGGGRFLKWKLYKLEKTTTFGTRICRPCPKSRL